MAEIAAILQMMHTVGSGPITVLLFGGGYLLYRARRDRLVTEARRDEALLPGILAGAAEERREWMARLERIEQIAQEAREAERECQRRCDDLAARLSALEG